ncbi:MAG: CHAT domain-containing protein, partial [Pseudomonadota bacterium]
ETAHVSRAMAAGDLVAAGARLARARRALDALPEGAVRDGLRLDLAAAAAGDGLAGPLCPATGAYDDGYAGEVADLLAPLLARRDAPRLVARAQHTAALLAARRCDLVAAQAASAGALRTAQAVGRADLLFAVNRRRAEIALARLDTATALDAYRAGFALLAGVRDDLAGQLDAGGRSLYRARLEPFHRAYIEVLLLQARLGNDQALLAEARTVIEDLKVVEVEDYFRERCVRVGDVALPVLPDDTVVLYPVILENRLELLVARGERLARYASPVGEAALTRLVEAVVPALRDPGAPWELATLRLYRALVQPVRAELLAPGVQTVVFVPDGALRQVPLATAYDGRQFLVQRRDVATLLGLTLQGGGRIERQQIDALVGGAPETVLADFEPLTQVPGEARAVAGLLGTEARLGDGLTAGEFRSLLRGGRFNLVHVAAHARFGETPEENLIALSDGAVTVDTLVQALRARAIESDRRLDLLTLSACDTAVGSDAAPLGLAGAAYRADVSSVLASLWRVPDAPTAALMEGFYANLVERGLGRAAALAEAQRAFLEPPDVPRHPARWGAFIMLGEWR